MIRLFVWLMRTLLVLGTCLAVTRPNEVSAQTSSLFRRGSANTAGLTVRPVRRAADRNKSVMEQVSYFAVKPLPKRIFKVGDLVTVIVRQQSTYKHSGKTDLKRELALKAELKDWIRFKSRRLIPASMPEGDPKIDFSFAREFEGEGKKDRKDEVITRITCRIIDVKPNGNLVIQGRDRITTDGEKQFISLTGTCRSEDIAPDNTILSTQIGDLVVDRKSGGAVRDAMRRGWAYKIWDLIRPF